MEEWSRDRIRDLLNVSDKAVARAIVVIYQRQTLDEQRASDTKHQNKLGFTSAHAKLGSYFARWVIGGRTLTGRHLDRARAIALHYTRQLLDEIEAKKEANI